MVARIFLILFILALVFVGSRSSAEVDGFWVWQPEPGGIKYVIPKRPGESPAKFVQRYQRLLRASATYGGMKDAQFVRLSTAPSTFSEMPASTSAHPNVQVVLNKPDQMTDKNSYLKRVVSSFEKEGARLYAIPVGLETVMNPQDMTQFRRRLNSMDGQLGVGGDDPHPQTYGSEDTSQTLGDISAKRDIEQTKYMKEYLANGRGRVFYICGSMQRAGIADGHDLYPDLAHLGAGPQRGERGVVMLEVVAEPGSELAIAAGATKFQASNYHHAGLKSERPQAGRQPTTKITAYNVNPDGSRGPIVKSIEFNDNAGFATQFHPEFRGSIAEARIVRYVATGWKMRGRFTPSAIVKCMERNLSKLWVDSGGGTAP